MNESRNSLLRDQTRGEAMSTGIYPIVVARSEKPPGAGPRKLLRNAGLAITSAVLLFGVFGFTSVPDAHGGVSYVTGDADRVSCGSPWIPRDGHSIYQSDDQINGGNCSRAMAATGETMRDWFAAGVFLLSASFLTSPLPARRRRS